MSAFEIPTPLVIEITKRAQPDFKKNPFISMEDDPNSTFSSIPYDIFHIEDVRVYTL